ncbi:ABC transporter ATP-binding protein [Amycolatopsis sp. CA-230715]|uniref:ABC transporter ATP-binding protein n=1 Tax=Amycolatopsis sp. CA-230715 TaxID=2745196 RepID=UPI001C02540F|nr:ABC transporter ATP-binding protein [Amycolatopsis sp. CA-230715]QWF77880.1 Fe(3+) dicitrate transport ATP-binding protein FecE [Amycolatopsis sp. CA-230715]
MRIEAESLRWGVPAKTIIDDIAVSVGTGEVLGLVGPNGSGKSSLLRCLAGLRKPSGGTVRYDGADIAGWDSSRIARRVAFVDQYAVTESDLLVVDVVALGRTPFRTSWRGHDHHDTAVVNAALDRMGLTELRARPWKTLSGGEHQRTHIARALAQEPSAILLDEPTNHLDIRHQLELMRLLAAAEQTAVVVLHDLSLAARFCDRLALMHHGRLVASGPPCEVLTPARIQEVFGVEAEVGPDRGGDVRIHYR